MATVGPAEDAAVTVSAPNNAADRNFSLNEAAVRLKQLESDGTLIQAPCRADINVNMNNQGDVEKLTEKSLSGVAPLRPPEDLKSNILKAQAEAALKVAGGQAAEGDVTGLRDEHVPLGEKNCNLQEKTARDLSCPGLHGEEVRTDDPACQPPAVPASEALPAVVRASASVPQQAAAPPPLSAPLAELEMPLTPQWDNLIDFSEPPLVPKVVPRWILPAAATGMFAHGLLGGGDVAPLHPDGGGPHSAISTVRKEACPETKRQL